MKATQERQLQEAVAEAEAQAQLEREPAEAEAARPQRKEEERRRREERERAEEAVRRHSGQMDQQSNSRGHTIGHQSTQTTDGDTNGETDAGATESTPTAAPDPTSPSATPNPASAEPVKKGKGSRPKGSKNKPKPERWVPKPRAKPGRKSEPGPSTATSIQNNAAVAAPEQAQTAVVPNGTANADGDEDEDEEEMAAELEAMIAKMKRWKSKDPSVFQKLWEGMKKGNGPKPSAEPSGSSSVQQSTSRSETKQPAATVASQLPTAAAVVEQQVMEPGSSDTGTPTPRVPAELSRRLSVDTYIPLANRIYSLTPSPSPSSKKSNFPIWAVSPLNDDDFPRNLTAVNSPCCTGHRDAREPVLRILLLKNRLG